jgi:hypothetical protein
MENLNAENIINEIQSLIKALKDCGGWVERGNGEGWFNHEILADALAIITSQEQRIAAQDMTISELRQRCDKAKHDADRYAQKIKENEKIGIKNFDLICELSRIKEDTVRKMQEALCEGRVSNDPVVIAVNVAAKEVLEGKDENT